MRVAIQGEAGSFHHEAAKKWFGPTVEIVPAGTFGGVFGALEQANAETGIVAVENSLYGSIDEVLGLIEKHKYPIVGEIYLHIGQQLVTLPGAKLENITRVYSHPVALAQCEHFLDEKLPHAERIEHQDTAASVAFIKKQGDWAAAAIAGRGAAELYGLPILAENIEDNKANFTRFLVIDPAGKAPETCNKFSLVLTASHTPGTLAKALVTFADAGANLTKLESRPIVGSPWQYRFYIDVETSPEQFERAIATIQKDGATLTVLGKYVSATP